ncbi:hypothetical protein HPB52_005203 [Rhipicephalus sanguineus]|uniref:C2H2-type domain-containing protein n=1 Tax=Rhipicephalus sanguineus TaxID=34632 RepID=A0A9D4QEN3_RHISA|nr:hypothetical protein HPB52_005203 [Rhipicephalus sanguineus]
MSVHAASPADVAKTPADPEPQREVDAAPSPRIETPFGSDSNSVDGTPATVNKNSTIVLVPGDTGVLPVTIKQEPLEEHESEQIEEQEEEHPCCTMSKQAEGDGAELDDDLTTCSVCGEPFGANHLLRRAAYHAEHRLSYVCHLCPSRFGSQHLLVQHLKQHRANH